MTPIQTFWLVIGSTWALAELLIAVLTRKYKSSNTKTEVHSEKLIWLVICVSLSTALILKNMDLWTIPLPADTKFLVGLVLLLTGLVLRVTAVSYLGRFFSTQVNIHHCHQLIRNGPYHYVRHPSYTGLMCSFLGAGIAMGDFVSLITLLVPLVLILIKRINTEEPLLQKHFEKEYRDYCQSTKKLFPGVY